MASYNELTDFIAKYKSAAVAFSGGVDSTLLAKAVTDVLGEKSLCILVKSDFIPESELDFALRISKEHNFNLKVINADILKFADVIANKPDRCYECKKIVFDLILKEAAFYNINNIFDGSNKDDLKDYRPGKKALIELGVISPFMEIGWGKDDIRAVSKEVGLETWNKPAYACLASRVPYDTVISKEILGKIEKAEAFLMKMGFQQCRMRYHDNIARIEIPQSDFEKILKPDIRESIIEKLKSLGFNYITLDLVGYRTGSMNEEL